MRHCAHRGRTRQHSSPRSRGKKAVAQIRPQSLPLLQPGAPVREAVGGQTMTLKLLSAGAGTGKTRHLVSTVSDAIGSLGFDIRRILAVTFTEAAAAELKLRVKTELLQRGQHEQARWTDTASIQT